MPLHESIIFWDDAVGYLTCFYLYVQSSAQQALMGTINTSMQAVQKAQIDLGEVDNLPPLGQDMVLSTARELLMYIDILIVIISLRSVN